MTDSNTPEADRDQWRTPPWLFKYCRLVLLSGLNNRVYDAACNRGNALAPPVTRNYGDSLKSLWRGNVFCNPPYSDISPWVDAAFRHGGPVVMLIPSPNGEDRYRRLIDESREIHIIGRVGFIGKDGKPVNGNPRGSSLFIIGDGGEGTRICIDRETIRNWNYKTSGYET